MKENEERGKERRDGSGAGGAGGFDRTREGGRSVFITLWRKTQWGGGEGARGVILLCELTVLMRHTDRATAAPLWPL